MGFILTDGLSKDQKRIIKKFIDQFTNGQKSFDIQTSGSTGEPQIINITRDQMIASAQLTQSYFDLKSGYKALVCLNTEYIAGLMMLVRCMVTDMEGTIVNPTANPLNECVRDNLFDFAAFVPYQLHRMLFDNFDTNSKLLNRMKVIILGGAPVSHELEQRIALLTVPVYQTFGMTETISHIAARKLNGEKKETYYTILPQVEIKTNERKCLMVKAPQTLGKWITSNDMAELISVHKFNWLGRYDNVINSGGLKVQIESIEKAIELVFFDFGLMKRFVVFGKSDNLLHEKICILIESEPFALEVEDQVKAKLSHLLAKYQSPKDFLYLNHFRETKTGKIDRKATLELIQ